MLLANETKQPLTPASRAARLPFRSVSAVTRPHHTDTVHVANEAHLTTVVHSPPHPRRAHGTAVPQVMEERDGWRLGVPRAP